MRGLFIIIIVLFVASVASAHEPQDALDRLNYQRAQQGLYAYERDPELTKAALAIAKYRADHGIRLHTANDFNFLPKGTFAPMAGCAAWSYGHGFGACGVYERKYKRCGAAWCVGRNGLVYCHAFYR